MYYFSSDLHLGHRAVLRMNGRPFETIEEMNRAIITNINARVHRDDTLYLLGDLAFRIPVEEANELIAKLKCKKILIRGNHDKNYDESLFEGVYDFLEINYGGHSISLMHYPMVEWPKSFHGSIHLHGHQHNNLEYNVQQRDEGVRRYDVGVDANYFFPVSAKEFRFHKA